jgi:hypothetical protein
MQMRIKLALGAYVSLGRKLKLHFTTKSQKEYFLERLSASSDSSRTDGQGPILCTGLTGQSIKEEEKE